MTVLETERLTLRHLVPEDAEFAFRLVNEPSFLQYIGDKGVRTLDDARNYLATGAIASYARHGFGLNHVRLRAGDVPIGMCGLVKREALPDADIGYAFLPEFWSKGYAIESATAVLAHAQEVFGLRRILAIVSPDNRASIALLERLGMHFESTMSFAGRPDDTLVFATESAR
jgi:RimJ/RimL family protein N-acetyltransferase